MTAATPFTVLVYLEEKRANQGTYRAHMLRCVAPEVVERRFFVTSGW